MTLLAGIILAGCTNDDAITVVTGPQKGTAAEETPILFRSNAKAVTRASHEESAQLLGKKFYVFGTKTIGETTSTLFDNYLVEYSEGTAGKTATNTSDWEYAGKLSKKGATQSVKYWDYSAQHTDFVAAAGLGEGEIIKNTTDGMRIAVSSVETMTNVYVADRITATPTAQAATGTTPATEAYGNTITFQFRRLNARMRIGFYETISGYAVKDLVFYYIGAPNGSYTVGAGTAFPKSGVYTVDYDDATNAAVSTFVGANNKYDFSNTFGQLAYTSAPSQAGVEGMPYIAANGTPTDAAVNRFLGTTSATATFGRGYYTIDGTEGVESDFKPILPNENNKMKMQLRLDYTLVALDGSGEEIHVRDAYVSVPVDYLNWKPNYSYTYIFRISENTNGYTGEGGGGDITDGPGRDPDPDNGGGDNDPIVDPETGEIIDPYVPDPDWPLIPDPDDPDGPGVPDPDAPLVPNPDYPDGPDGDQHDPSNPVPDPTIPDPENPDEVIPDPSNPASLFPITFDAVVIETQDGQTVYTNIDGTDNSSNTEH